MDKTDERELILIVDDFPKNLQVLGNILEEKYRTAVAKNARNALDFIEKRRPDLVLLDIMMPGMDGYQACEMLKRSPGTKDIPVIFLTAKNETEDIVRGFKAGAVDFVSKPFKKEELLARIETHLELKRTRENLQKALSLVKQLSGLLPICSKCKKIRDEKGDWRVLESYIRKHSEAEFSHGICPGCAEELYGNEPWFKEHMEKEKGRNQAPMRSRT